MRAGFEQGANITLQGFLKLLRQRGHKSAGSIRVSFGLASNFVDAWRFWRFAQSFRDQTNLAIGDVTFDIAACRFIRDGS
jgi:hypothetical protein